MEVSKKLSDTGSFLDYSQGPSNIDVHAVYTTSHVGASKGLLSSGNNLATYILEGHNDQQRQVPVQEAQLNGVETFAAPVEGQETYGDAVVVEGQYVQGSSQVIETDNVVAERIQAIVGVDPAVLNAQVTDYNYNASSNLVVNQQELVHVHEGQIREDAVVNQSQEVVESKVEPIVVNQETVVVNQETVVVPQETVVAEQKVEEPVNTEVAQPTTTEQAAAAEEGQVAAQKEEKGLVTKGTLAIKPISFTFVEKNEKLAKVKPLFKAKVGGHHKASHAGKYENEIFTWTEEIVNVGYSNQDDATFEVKKAGMFGKTIAAGKIALADVIAQRQVHSGSVQLLDKEKVVGELKYEIEFKPKAK